MPANILLEERQLSFYIPAGMPDPKAVRIRRVLQSRRFLSALRQSIRTTLKRFASLHPLRVQVR